MYWRFTSDSFLVIALCASESRGYMCKLPFLAILSSFESDEAVAGARVTAESLVPLMLDTPKTWEAAATYVRRKDPVSPRKERAESG